MIQGGPAVGDDRAPVLRLRAAAVGYGEVTVVDGVDLELARGEVVALLGANGSGKTTLVRGLLGLATVHGGDIELFGEPVGHLTRRWRVGYVPQRHTVAGAIPSTVREVVASGRLPRRGLLARHGRSDRLAVRAALAEVGLAERDREAVSTLSGGQQRRVLIARALASEPELLVMDEPTAGVDAANQRALVDVMRRLAGRGVAVLVVTHEVGPMAAVVDRAVVLQAGRVRYQGPLTAQMLGASDGGRWDGAPQWDGAHWDGHHPPADDSLAGAPWVPDLATGRDAGPGGE